MRIFTFCFLTSTLSLFSSSISFGQNWSPFNVGKPNYFLVPITSPPGAQECLAVRFDTTIGMSSLFTAYRKKWPVFAVSQSRFDWFVYRPWNYIGNIFEADTLNGDYRLATTNAGVMGSNNLTFQPGLIQLYSPKNIGDVVVTSNGFHGILESKHDTVIESESDSVAVIRLHGAFYSGRKLVLSKRNGLLLLPCFRSDGDTNRVLTRHFEGPNLKFDFQVSDKKSWAPGDELHYVEGYNSDFPGGMGYPPSTTVFNKKTIVHCQSNGSGGLVFSGTFDSYRYYQEGTSPATTTIVQDSAFVQIYPPSGSGETPFSPSRLFLPVNVSGTNNNSTYPIFGAVNGVVLPGNLPLKYSYEEIFDAGSEPLVSVVPFPGGQLSRWQANSVGATGSAYGYPVFYKFGNDSAGVRLPRPTSVQNDILNRISVYPNPGTQFCVIASDLGEIQEVTAINQLGLQTKLPFDKIRNHADLRNLVPGLYFLNIRLSSGQHNFIRIIKQ